MKKARNPKKNTKVTAKVYKTTKASILENKKPKSQKYERRKLDERHERRDEIKDDKHRNHKTHPKKSMHLRDEVWQKTGWGKVASWYDQTVKKASSSQRDIILPEILAFLPKENVKDKRLLDLGCGTGYFLKEYLKGEPEMALGIDIDDEILELARENLRSELGFYNSIKEGEKKLGIMKADASDLHGVGDDSFDIVLSIESLVNMSDLRKVALEVNRVLVRGGRFVCVINHPCFRVPKSSDWHFDNVRAKQGRVVYKYKTSHMIKIDMNPGSKRDKVYTYTFHRTLQEYLNTFVNTGFGFIKIKEVCSNRVSEKGPKKTAEDEARKEIPMFMILEFNKL